MKVVAVMVHYRTPGLVPGAAEALRNDAAAAGLALDLVLVDNGSDPGDRAALEGAVDLYLEPGENLGYAGAINRGADAVAGDVVLVLNPDVEVLPGCLAALMGELAAGAAVVGPAFYWERGRRWRLPPTEAIGRRAALRRALAGRGGAWARRARRAWRRHARRHWQATEPLDTFDLSGALLAIDGAAWRRVGPFDDAYRLYFEETDWLLRCRRAGLAGRLVPAASAVHLYAQSSAGEAESNTWFAASAARFRRRTYGARFAALLERSSPAVIAEPPAASLMPKERLLRGRQPSWLELSASPLGFPAAGRRHDGDDEPLPTEVARRLAPGRYYLRRVGDDGTELGVAVFDV